MIDLKSFFPLFLSFFNSKLFLALQIAGGVISLILLVVIIILIAKGAAFVRHIRHLLIAWRKSVIPKGRMKKMWGRILKRMESGDPSDWRQAVMLSDQMLDETLRRIGYEGKTMEERFSNIKTIIQFPMLEEAQRVRKIHNFLAEDPEYPLGREVAERTIEIYKKIFMDIGALL